MKTTHLEEKRKALIEKREKLIGRFNQAARSRERAPRACARRFGGPTIFSRAWSGSWRKTPASRTRAAALRGQLAVPARMLQEAHRRSGRAVLLHHRLGGRRRAVLDQWAEFAHQRRTRMGVVADMPSTHNLLIKLEQFGHKFLAHFHSHPGNGPGRHAALGHR